MTPNLIQSVHSIDVFDFDASRHAYSVQDSMRIIAHHKEGVIVLLRWHEAADEILKRFSPAASPARGVRTWDPKLHGIGAQILRDLGVSRMRLMAQPRRMPSMTGFDLQGTGFVLPGDPL